MMGEAMDVADLLGWVAVMFTLTAFSMRTMLPLRAAAIGANFCFIGFGYLEGTLPILTLHAILLPCNVMRLRQIILAKREVDQQNESGLQDGMVAVATVGQGSTEFELGLSAARPAEYGAQEIVDLRAEVAALREQLRQSVSDKTDAWRSTSDKKATLGIGDVASSCIGVA